MVIGYNHKILSYFHNDIHGYREGFKVLTFCMPIIKGPIFVIKGNKDPSPKLSTFKYSILITSKVKNR